MTRRQVVDVAPTAVLLPITLAEVLLTDEITAPRGLVVLAAVLLTVPLVWRRRAPLAVLTLALVVVGVFDTISNFADAAGSPFAGVLLAVYSGAAYARSRRELHAGAAAMLVFLLALIVSSPTPVGDFFFIGGIMFGVWGAAVVVRSRQELATALAARTVELEHEREEKARLAVAEERARIARELHDVVAHHVSVMVVQAGAERREVATERPQTAEVLETIEHTGRVALAETRRLLGMLRRSDDELALAPQPSLDGLETLVAQVQEAGLPVELRVEGERRPLPPGVDLSAYRIVQEALTNALKHAGPARARIVVRYGREQVEVEVADDGAGAAEPAVANGNGQGHGLVGMRERVALVGGDLSAGRRLAGGYAVRARLPVPPEAR
jgi:signal transduction histidine kinase